jgi:hypothetical protein
MPTRAMIGLGPNWRRAPINRSLKIWEGLPIRSGEDRIETTFCHATLAALAGRAGSGIPAGEATAQAARAMARLAKAVGLGERHLLVDRNESALDGLRNRGDFRALMMDLAMPSWPFAREAALNDPESAGDPPGRPTLTALSVSGVGASGRDPASSRPR